MSVSTVDRLFIAVNFEGVPGGLDDNPDKELCRYEFFELLVRMAIAKFPSHPPAEALKKLVEEYLLCDPGLLSWWKFRQELVWTLEVDDLLKANAHLSRKLYLSVQTIIKKQFHLEDAVQMVSHSTLKLADKETTLAFSYSKFPVTDEMEDISNVQLLNFSEFQEFICRLGQVKYLDPQMPLYDKVLRVMTEIFKLIGEKPVLPQINDIADSESDYDEFEDKEPEKVVPIDIQDQTSKPKNLGVAMLDFMKNFK